MVKYCIFHPCDIFRPSGDQRLSMPQSYPGGCAYSSCDRDLVFTVNQLQLFPDRQRDCNNTVTWGKVAYPMVQCFFSLLP